MSIIFIDRHTQSHHLAKVHDHCSYSKISMYTNTDSLDRAKDLAIMYNYQT